jgi:hypothetical protein
LTAAHSEVDGQETPLRAFVPSMFAEVRQVGDAAVGFVVLTAFPALSTATHSAVVGHETAVRMLVPSMFAEVRQVGDAAAGFVVLTAFPALSTPTHRLGEAHETAVRTLVPSMSEGDLQVGLGAVGSMLLTTVPPLPTATHSDVEGHEIALSASGPEEGGLSISTGAAHETGVAVALPAAMPGVAPTAHAQIRGTKMPRRGVRSLTIHPAFPALARHASIGTP